jgi:uncharacterized RmlC-like cupin family protein
MNNATQAIATAATEAGLTVPAHVPTVDEVAQAKADKKTERETRKEIYAEANRNRKKLAEKLKAEKEANAQTEATELASLKAQAEELSKTDSSLKAVLIRRKLQAARDKYNKIAKLAGEEARHNRILAAQASKSFRTRTPAETVAYEQRKAKAAAKKAATVVAA